MKHLFKYFLMLVSSAVLMFSCTPSGQDTEVVPEGVLKIFADKTTIAADGVDKVTFRVMFGSRDVSNEKTMKLVRTSAGKEIELPSGANVFSTTAEGESVFKAYLYSGGEHWSVNEIVVTAVASAGQKDYRQMVLAEQFTSVGCVNCPTLTVQIKEAQDRMPGVLVPVSFHMDYNMPDPMTIAATGLFYTAYQMSGLPYLNLNMRSRGGGVNRENIVGAVQEELELYPTACGVAIETSYDPSTREVSITSRITSNVAARYKYHIFLLEDGIEYAQQGVSGNYVHNNVVRKMFAQDITGMNINRKQPFVPGQEVKAENAADLAPAWNPDNMRVVVVALTSSDGERTWACSNVNVCGLGESVDYIYNE